MCILSPIRSSTYLKRLTKKKAMDTALAPRCRQKAASRNLSGNEPRTTTFAWWTKSGFQNPLMILLCTSDSSPLLSRQRSADGTRSSYAWPTKQAHVSVNYSHSPWGIGENVVESRRQRLATKGATDGV